MYNYNPYYGQQTYTQPRYQPIEPQYLTQQPKGLLGKSVDSVEFIEQYLDYRYERTCHYSKTVDEFMKEFPQGIYLISMPGHLSCVIDGVNIDTFDTSNRRMWCAWFVSK